jgi:ankyrin repeat protein
VNQRNQSGATALSWALRGNEQDMAAALRRAGAKE